MMIQADIKKSEYMAQIRMYCKCGHSIIMPKYLDKRLCDWCGHWVYRTKEIEFKEKLKSQMVRGAK